MTPEGLSAVIATSEDVHSFKWAPLEQSPWVDTIAQA